MEEENREKGVGDSIHMFLKEALRRQRDEWMEILSQIL
jgi:hypothetical protein